MIQIRSTQQNSTAPEASELKLVVVGNGPVGYDFLKKWTLACPDRKHTVHVFGEEPRPAYDRVNLTSFFRGKSLSDLTFASEDWYTENNLELSTGNPVVKVDRAYRQVYTRDGQSFHYDRLVLATGSKAFVPPLEGRHLPGVFVYRTIDDMLQIQEASKSAKTAAVIGGGLLGLEAAQALQDCGLEVQVLEVAAALMPRQLDQEASNFLRERVEELGIQIGLTKRTKSIVQNGDQLEIELKGEPSITVDMIVISAGIRPRDELAEICGIRKGERGGFAVNKQMQTSDPSVYAIGECASCDDVLYGLINPGKQMASVAVDHLCGRQSQFMGADGTTSLKLVGVNVSTLGDYLESGVGYRNIAKLNDSYYRKLVLHNDRLIGALSVGDDPELPRLHEAVLQKRKLSFRQTSRFEKEGILWDGQATVDINNWPADAMICSCKAVCRGELTEAYRDGATTLTALMEATTAGTSCGSCQPLLCSIVGENPVEASPKTSWWLGGVSVITLLIACCLIFLPEWAYETSVQTSWYEWEALYRESFLAQVSGFTMLGLVVIGLLFSLRKRWTIFRWGDYGAWRFTHALLSSFSLAAVCLHTGMSRGNNLNFALFCSFLVIQMSGAVSGLITTSEAFFEDPSAVRQLRRRLIHVHTFLFWPLPVLIAFHVLSVYYFGS